MSAEKKTQAKVSRKVAGILKRLQDLGVHVEELPSGAYRLRKGPACHVLVARLEYLGEDDFLMFAGKPARIFSHFAVGQL